MTIFVDTEKLSSTNQAEEAVLLEARAIITRRWKESKPSDCKLTSPEIAGDFVRLHLVPELKREHFIVIFLNNQHQYLSYETLFVGTLDAATVYPREVVKAAMNHNAAAVILAHNHPSGEQEPSKADRTITEHIKAALGLVDVRVLDHLVVGEDVVSFAERGWI